MFIRFGWDEWEIQENPSGNNPTNDLYVAIPFQIVMTLQRKVREVGNSLNVVIPSQIAELHGIDEGSLLEFQPMEKGVFKIIRIGEATMCTIKKIGSTETKRVPKQLGRCIAPKGWEVK